MITADTEAAAVSAELQLGRDFAGLPSEDETDQG